MKLQSTFETIIEDGTTLILIFCLPYSMYYATTCSFEIVTIGFDDNLIYGHAEQALCFETICIKAFCCYLQCKLKE